MKQLKLKCLQTLSAGMLATACFGMVNAEESKWYIPADVVHTDAVDERFSDDGLGFAIGAGYRYSTNMAYEASLFANEFDEGDEVDASWSEVGLRLAALYYLVDGEFEPFVSLGIAGAKTDAEVPSLAVDESETHAQADVGVGLDWNITEAGTGVRAGVRYRMSFFDIAVNDQVLEEDPSELQFTLGAKFALGGSDPVPVIVDTDGDGVNDDLDKCPGTRAGQKVNAEGCVLDTDGDNVPDGLDKCPNTPKGTKVDWTGCERKPADTDKDGVPDTLDKCPKTPAGVKVYANGCAVPETKTLGDVLFKYKSDDLNKPARRELDELAAKYGALMKQYPTLKLQVSGHTDSVASDEYNLKLSERRAASVLKYLVSKGIDKARIISIGFGEKKPVATNETDAGRAQNRRVELKLLGRGK